MIMCCLYRQRLNYLRLTGRYGLYSSLAFYPGRFNAFQEHDMTALLLNIIHMSGRHMAMVMCGLGTHEEAARNIALRMASS